MTQEMRTRPTTTPEVSPDQASEPPSIGPAAAAILAAGIGCLALGLIVPLSEAIPCP